MSPALSERGSLAHPQDWTKTGLGVVLSTWSSSAPDSLCLGELSHNGQAWGRGSLLLCASAIPGKPVWSRKC